MERVLADPVRAVAGPAPSRLNAKPWADLRRRLASALVLAALALVCVWFGGRAWNVLISVAFLGVAWEWWQLCGIRRPGELLAGFAFAALATLALAWLRADPVNGFAIVVFVLAVVWCSDVGAYVAGRLIGGKRLAPAISPGKTWSGAAGGLLAAILGGLVMTPIGEETSRAAIAAAVLGLVSQMGDLLESALKRKFGVKDSGRLIPGHGGLLDRLDGMMPASLAAAAWIIWVGRGDALWR